ncbi:hypothetical protein EAD96_18875 [Micromonospora sp. BL1]|uniref:AMP-binding protein n=1 Tax=unclassified Micromonospora TaxID=2617518 RepID=UPI000EF5AECC|nr:AMP-binding protein [Micromonospora sp. BL1]NED50676.1 amino acid adenylation domain-containing protein [Micromonospora aurantiaca]RLQ03539.1 hypothetical protein EAD96_18875 [Micromonospora sp. BL1]
MTPGPGIRTLAERVTGHAERAPASTAMRWLGEDVTYADLTRLVDRHRRRLTMLGIRAGHPVAAVAPVAPDTVALILACHRIGAPVLLPSGELPAETLSALLRQAGCRHQVVADGDEVTVVPSAEPVTDPSAAVPADTPFLLTTSGSTGVPKVVPVSGRAIHRFAGWAGGRFGIGPGTRVLSYAPLNFDLSLLDVWTTLHRGGCVVPVARNDATDGRRLLDLLARERPEIVQAVPMFYQLLVAARPRLPLPSVRHVLYSGDAAPARLLAELPRLLPRAAISSVYGCTEINDAFVYQIPPGRPAPDPVPLGEPVPGVEWLLADDHGRPVDGPGSGELWVRTPFQTSGYLDAARTSERFAVPVAGVPHEPFFRTGDVVRRCTDGALHLQGRIDFHVKVRGVQVNLQAVERVLLECPGVAEAVVVALDDPVAGKRLHAVVRTAGGAPAGEMALRRHCAGQLARTSVPSRFHLVTTPLPRTGSGKPDRIATARVHLGATP